MDRFTEDSILDLARNFRLSHQPEPEPFFAIGKPCQDCGRPTGGVDCPCHDEEAPEDPRCPIEYQILMAIESVAAMSYEVKLHRLTCPLCNRIRKQPRSQGVFIERQVAA